MGANYRAVDHLHLGVFPMRYGSLDTTPNACATPTHEAIVAGGVGTVSLRQITPRCSRSQNPENAVQDTPVILTRDVSRFARKDWCDQPPFGVREGVSHAQGSYSELESHPHDRLQCLLCTKTLQPGPLGRPTASNPNRTIHLNGFNRQL